MLPVWAVAGSVSVASLAFTGGFSVPSRPPLGPVRCGPAGLASPSRLAASLSRGHEGRPFFRWACHARSRAWAAVCRSWAAAEHGGQPARYHGREPAGAMGARGGRGRLGPARRLGWCITLRLAVRVCGPGLCQAVVEEGWAHRGLLGDVARFGGVAWCRPLISSAGPVPRVVPPSLAASGFTTRDHPHNTSHKPTGRPEAAAVATPGADRDSGIGRPGGPGSGTTTRQPPAAGRRWRVTV